MNTSPASLKIKWLWTLLLYLIGWHHVGVGISGCPDREATTQDRGAGKDPGWTQSYKAKIWLEIGHWLIC